MFHLGQSQSLHGPGVCCWRRIIFSFVENRALQWVALQILCLTDNPGPYVFHPTSLQTWRTCCRICCKQTWPSILATWRMEYKTSRVTNGLGLLIGLPLTIRGCACMWCGCAGYLSRCRIYNPQYCTLYRVQLLLKRGFKPVFSLPIKNGHQVAFLVLWESLWLPCAASNIHCACMIYLRCSSLPSHTVVRFWRIFSLLYHAKYIFCVWKKPIVCKKSSPF